MAFSRLGTEHHLKIEIFFVRPEHAKTVVSAGSVLNFPMKSAKFAIGLVKRFDIFFICLFNLLRGNFSDGKLKFLSRFWIESLSQGKTDLER